MIHLEAEHRFGAACRLGESPIWSADGTLVWVDVKQGRAHSLDWDGGGHRIFELGIPVTSIAPRKGGWVTASCIGLHLWDAQLKERKFIGDPCADSEGIRLNDSLADRFGRLWVGSMNERQMDAPDGALYRVDPDHSIHQLDSGLCLANGICMSPAGDTLYVTDMFRFQVVAYDHNSQTGELSNKRVAVKFPEGPVRPDGLTVDTEGHLWVGHWLGGCVTRHHPETGELLAKVKLPVSHATRATFGGSLLNELIVTSAWHGVESDLPNQPLAGDVFSCPVPFQGLPEGCYLG